MLPRKTDTPYKNLVSGITLAALCVLLLFVMFHRRTPASIGAEPQASTERLIQLAPASSIRGEIAPGGKQIFEISVEQGKLLRFLIDKGDLALSTVLYSPTGARLLEHVSQELEPVEGSFPADVAGTYTIELKSREKAEGRKAFEVRVQPLMSVTPLNRKESEARQLIAAAEVLRATWTASGLSQARDKYDAAALIWTSTSDLSNASFTMLRAGDVCFALSQFEEAIKRYKTAAAQAEKKGDRLAQSRALSQMGRLYSQMGDNSLAQKLVATALDLLKPAEGESNLTRVAYGEALMNMAEISYSRGNYPNAKERVEEALKFLDQDRKAQARAHLFVGSITGTLGNPEKAYSEISHALGLSRAINDQAGEGLALVSLGIFYWSKGNHDEAVRSQRSAIEMFQKMGDRHSEAIAYNGLGQAYHYSERSLALTFYEKALSLFESTGALDSVAVATFKLATIYVDDNPEKALTYLDRCLALSRAAGKLHNEANALSEIAIVYASQDRSVEAARQHAKALKFYEAIGDKRGEATALNKYGEFLLNKLGKTQQALDDFNQALSLSESVEDKALLTTTLYNVARAHQVLGNLEISLSFIERSIRIIEDLRANVGSPGLRALYFSGVQQYYVLCRDVLMQLENLQPTEGYAKRAFLMSEKSRARSLLDLVNESPADLRKGAAADLLVHERELSRLIGSLVKHEWDLRFKGETDSTDLREVSNKATQLNAEYQEIQAKLRAQHPRQSQLVDFELKDLTEVQNALLGSDTMLLEYALGEDRSYLWAITSDSFQSYQLPGRKTLEDATREAYNLMTARQQLAPEGASDLAANIELADRQYREKAVVLSQMLLSPVAEQFGNRSLVIVADGALQFVPFEALPVRRSDAVGSTESERPLLATNQVSALPSMSTLLAMRSVANRSSSRGKIVAIIADPVLNRSDERLESEGMTQVVAHPTNSLAVAEDPAASVLRGFDANRLIHASEEADAIVAAAPRGTTMVAKGFDANRDTAMSPDVGKYQIIHFATHGLFNSEHPESTSIVLTMVDQKGVDTNGLMPLHEIYNLDLSAQLTVLSACQTALGKDIKGEGLVGLTHSFMSAGSRSVVASLWKVDDRATAALMAEFYKSMLRDGRTPVAALRAAKLKMMHDKNWSAPYFWAGFVFQGDYETRIDVDSSSRPTIILVIVLLVLISSGLIVFLRRRRRLFPRERN